MAFCTTCGAQIPEGVTACPVCSRSAAPGTVAVQPVAGGLTDNVAGMLAYFTFIPAIVFLVLEPFNKKPFIRFHSFQSIFFAVAVIAIQIALSIVGMVPFLFFITFPLHLLVWLGSMAIWVVLILKAYQGQMFKLPIIGDMAANQAGV